MHLWLPRPLLQNVKSFRPAQQRRPWFQIALGISLACFICLYVDVFLVTRFYYYKFQFSSFPTFIITTYNFCCFVLQYFCLIFIRVQTKPQCWQYSFVLQLYESVIRVFAYSSAFSFPIIRIPSTISDVTLFSSSRFFCNKAMDRCGGTGISFWNRLRNGKQRNWMSQVFIRLMLSLSRDFPKSFRAFCCFFLYWFLFRSSICGAGGGWHCCCCCRWWMNSFIYEMFSSYMRRIIKKVKDQKNNMSNNIKIIAFCKPWEKADNQAVLNSNGMISWEQYNSEYNYKCS